MESRSAVQKLVAQEMLQIFSTFASKMDSDTGIEELGSCLLFKFLILTQASF